MKPTPVSDALLALGLLITNDSVVLPPTGIDAAPNELLIVGGETAVTMRLVVFDVAPGPL